MLRERRPKPRMRRCHSPSAKTRDAFHRIGDYLHRRPDIDAEESKGCCWCGSRQLLADQGVVSVQAGALMEPAGAGLVAASPVQPACGFPRRARQAVGPGYRCDL
jgi:hypothetical protein